MAFKPPDCMAEARRGNSHFKRIKKRSSLDPLLNIFGPNTGPRLFMDPQKRAIQDAIYKIPAGQQQRYLIAEQTYQYRHDGVQYQDIPGAAFLIEKTVQQVGESWVYIFKKTNWAPHNNNPFHFEVEYDIGPPIAYMPRSDEIGGQGLEREADLRRFARRVVSLG